MRKHHINGQNPIQCLAGIQWEPTRNGRNHGDNNDDDDGRNDKSSVQNINKRKRENQEDDDDTRFFFTFCKKSAGVLVVVAAVVVSMSTKFLWTVLFTRWSGSQLESLTLVHSFLHPCCDELLLLTTMLFSPPTSTFMVVAVEGLDGFTEKMGRWVEPLEETRKVWRAESNPLVASLKEGDFIKLSHSLSIVARRSINDFTLDFMSFTSDSAIF